jgi:hypothetical protein
LFDGDFNACLFEILLQSPGNGGTGLAGDETVELGFSERIVRHEMVVYATIQS